MRTNLTRAEGPPLRVVGARAPSLALPIAAATLFVATQASASPGITGASGKPYNGVSETCTTTCHAKGGVKPTLEITGVPNAMTAGETAQVTLVIQGTRTRTSMNAALSDGVVAKAGQNTAVPFPDITPGEVAAVAPPPSGATGTYKFSFVAPPKNGPITLWVAGMSASGSGPGGDGVELAQRTITVTGAPDPDPSTTRDGGAEVPDARSSSGNPGKPGDPNGSGSGNGDDGDGAASGSTSGGRRSSTPVDDGCAASPARANTGASASALAVACAAVVVARARRGGDRTKR